MMDKPNQNKELCGINQKIIAPTLQGRLRLNQIISYLLAPTVR